MSKDKASPLWVDVPTVPGGLVINLGDLMRRWTNDKWSSTLHRVVNPPAASSAPPGGSRRQSVAFFHNLNGDALVETITSCRDENGMSDYLPILAGEFLMKKHYASVKGVVEGKGGGQKKEL